MMWEVWRDGHFTGIIESNYNYAVKYWAERARLTGQKFKLKGVFVDDPTTKTGNK